MLAAGAVTTVLTVKMDDQIRQYTGTDADGKNAIGRSIPRPKVGRRQLGPLSSEYGDNKNGKAVIAR